MPVGRTRARRRDLHEDAGNVGRLLADGIHDLVAGRARLPVRELELDDADSVFGQFPAHSARLVANARIDRGKPVEGEHTLLHLRDQTILLLQREIAATVDDHLAIVRFDLGEEFDAAAELAIGGLHREQHEDRERQR